MDVEIFEEDGENSLSISDQYTDVTIDVYPDSKTYESRMSLREDVYYRTEKFDYRIKNDPIKVEFRLTERKDEPPEEYKVRDGVVLESDILKNNKFLGKDFIDELKKGIEWHEDWIGSPVSMYILSKHPDIISREEYRRYLRQIEEKIKAANLKIEKALESDRLGMQVTDEYEGSGRSIWFPRAKQDSMSEDETKAAIEHLNKIKSELFEEKSDKYVGITESEFSSTSYILKNVDLFLNKKDTPEKQTAHKTSGIAKLFAFLFQWLWLLLLVSIALWLLSLVISIIQYDFSFALITSGLLTIVLTVLRKQRSK